MIFNFEPWQRAEIRFHREGDYGKSPSRIVYANGEGVLRWSRLDYRDRPGNWTVVAETADESVSFPYPLNELDLGDLGSSTFGVPLKVYRGPRANIYFSDLVPAAFAVDLQDHLELFSRVLEEQLGIRSAQIPDLYVAGNWEQFNEVLKSQGIHFTGEGPAGYFTHRDPRPGIYLRTDLDAKFVLHATAHEYVHLVMKEYMGGKSTFVWISEGVAEYYAFEAGLQTARPHALRWILHSADTVRQGAQEEGLSLYSGLGMNPHDWGYMVVRYLTETLGRHAPIEVMTEYNDRDTSIEEGIEAVVGIDYDQFEQDFMAWLEKWEDPRRVEIWPYLALLQGTLDSIAGIGKGRRELMDALNANYDRDKAIEGHAPMVVEIERLLNELQGYSPPKGTVDLHNTALTYLERQLERMRLELKYYESGDNSAWSAAIAMIPELSARYSAFRQGVGNTRAAFNLLD